MTTLAIVEAPFDLTLIASSIKGAMADAGAKSKDLWQVPIDRIMIIEGLNPRIHKPSYIAHIRSIADSIKANGFYQDKPLAGFAAEVDGERVIYIYAGHTRLAGAKLAISEGYELKTLPITISQVGLSMEDIQIALIRGNDGEPLAAYETAVVCKRLIGGGMEIKEIAARVGRTETYVKNLLLLMAAPHALREYVAYDHVSATTAIDLIVEYGGGKALEMIEAGLQKAKSQGKTRMTSKHVKNHSYKAYITKSAPVMVEALSSVSSDPGYQSLSENTRALIDDLIKKIADNKEPENEKDERQNPLFQDSEPAA